MPSPPFTSEDIVVELGSSPGGWTKVLLDRSVRIISVDRSPLSAALYNHINATNMKHVIADGSKIYQKKNLFSFNKAIFMPPKPVDWVLCDMAVPSIVCIVLSYNKLIII